MNSILKIIFFVFLGIFAITGLFVFLGLVLGVTFGIVSLVSSFIWRIIFSPLVVIVFIIWLVLKLRRKPASK